MMPGWAPAKPKEQTTDEIRAERDRYREAIRDALGSAFSWQMRGILSDALNVEAEKS